MVFSVFGEVDFQKRSNIIKKVCGLNDNLSCPPAPRFDKTTILGKHLRKTVIHLNKSKKMCPFSLQNNDESRSGESVHHLVPRVKASVHKQIRE